MSPVNYGGHAANHETFVFEFLNSFPNPFAISKET